MSAPVDTPAIAGSSLREFLHGLPGVDQVGAEARAAMLASRSIKTTAKQWALDTAISMIDLTTLEGQDTPGKVRAMCAKAKRPDPADPTAPRVAAVCVYPDLAHLAAAEVKGTGILVTPIPLYHIFALTANCLLFVRLGWENVLIVNPRDFRGTIAELKAHPFDFITGKARRSC